MKILRFLGVFGVLCAFGFVGVPAYAGSTSAGDNGQPECTNGVCQVCDGDECANICDSGYWGMGGNSGTCTLCTTSPGNGFNKTLFGSAYVFNRTIGTCYKYCAQNSCTDISDPTDSIWAAYNLSGISIAPFDSEAGTRTIGFYEFNSNSGGACNTGTTYCPIIMSCSGTSSACKPRTKSVVFKDGNTTLGTLYVVRQTMWSSQNTNFQDDMNTASYSGVVFPIFQAPEAPEKLGYDFKGYYDAQTGGNQIIGPYGRLTQSNASAAETAEILYAQYAERIAPCGTEIYLNGGNGGTISSNCTMPFYPDQSGSGYATPPISPKCMPTNSDPDCVFTGFYLNSTQYYDENLGIQIPTWNLCSESSVTLTAGWNCPSSTHKVVYTCGAGTGSDTQDTATANQPYDILELNDTDCNKNNYDFNGWYFSGDHFTHNGGSTIQSWTYGDEQTFIAQWRGACNLITFDDNNAANTNVNSANTQRKRTADTTWYDVEPGDLNVCGKAYTSTDPQVSIPTNGNATFLGYFDPNDLDLNHAIFGTNGYPTSYGNSWTISASVKLKALWSCPDGYTWNGTTKQCEEDATCSRITFADNNGGGTPANANIQLYRKSGDTTHWYSDNKCSDKSIVATPHVNQPTWTGYAFMGYYTRLSGGTQIFDSVGAENTTNTSGWNVTDPVELQAQWTAGGSKVIYKCSDDGAAVIQDNATYGQPYDLLSGPTLCPSTTQQFTKWRAVNDGREYLSEQHINSWDYTDGTVTFVAQWGPLYIVRCPDIGAPSTMYQLAALALNESGTFTETEMNKVCYHSCPENQEQDGWDVYLNDPETLWSGSPLPNPINITGGVTYNNATPITLRPHCVTTTTSATYLCYKDDEGKVDSEVTLLNYVVRPLSWYHQCNINQNNFNGWLFSGDDAMHAAGSTISPWTYGANETFVPAYNASFDCNTTHWQAPSGGNHATQRVVLGDGLSMPAMNCVPRSEFSGWLPSNPNWISAYTTGLTSPVPGATCSGDVSVAGGDNFNWYCPTNLTFTPDDDLITQTLNLSCGSHSGQITVSYGDNISAMVSQWFTENCTGGPCAYPTNPTTYAHGYWKICANWNGVTPPGLTPVDGESGCYRTEPAHPNYDFSLLDPYWNQINNFNISSVWHCPKWVKYKCTADSEAIYQDNMSYAAYYEESYTVLDHETVGCGDSGYEFTGWYKEDQPSVEYQENQTVPSWPYDDVVILVGKNGNANDYDIVYHSLGGDDMNSSALCQHTFTYSANAQDFDPDISECVPARDLSTFLGWCTSSNTANCTPVEQIPAAQNSDLHLYAIWECISPYHSNPAGTACEACLDDQYWNGEECKSCATGAPGFPHSKQPFNWSEKTCYRECPSNTTLGASGQTCDANATLYGLSCSINVNFAQFTGSTGKQVEFYGNSIDGTNTCNNVDNTYCARGLFCSGIAAAFKPMTAPVNFYDADEHQMFGTRYIFGSRGGGTTIDLSNGKLWSLLAGSGQKTDVIHNNVGGVMMDYQYTHIIYPTYVAPTPDNILGMAFDGYYSARTGGTREVLDSLGLDDNNAMSVISDTTGDSNTARKVYAHYSNIDYTLTYDCGNGGTGNPTPAQVTGIHYGDSITPADNTCSNPGHNFGGWIVSPAGGIKQPGDTFTWQYTDDQVFTASWSDSVVYRINYELYGGTNYAGAPTTYTYESGATINGVPTRDNSIFDGWCTDATLQHCAMTQTIVHETGDKTFYAKWKCEEGYTLDNNLCNSNIITLVYNANNHGVAPTEPSSCQYGTIFTLPAAIVPNPADGYTFNKWTVNGGNFSASTQIACDYTNLGIYQGTATITATWLADGIVIDWNENGGTELLNGSCVYDGDLTLASAPVYSGHTFNGWLLADGVTYANASSTKPNGCVATYIGVTSGTSTQITAQWCENCTQPEHGTCTLVPNMDGTCAYSATCEDGYELSGNGTPTPVCGAGKFNITYRPNGGTPTEASTQSVDYLATFTTLAGTTFTKPNNIMTGWTRVSGGNYTGLATQYSYDVTVNTILDAAWGECVCNKGTGVDSCTTSSSNNRCRGIALCESGYINPSVSCHGTLCESECSRCPAGQISNGDDCEPCPAGTFQFGNECKPCENESISGGGATYCEPCESGYSANTNHTACDPNVITVIYANGGHGTAPAQTTCTYNQEFDLPSAMTDTGYTFQNWTVNGKTFNAEERIVCNYINLGVYSGTATITGTWNAGKYIVSFDANGGTGGQSASVTATYNQAMPRITSVAPVKVGYTFMGWYDNENYLNGTQYYTANGQSAHVYDKEGDTTLYAGWSTNVITINYSNGGHGTTPNSNTCAYGTSIVLPSAIVAEGFTFANWAVAGNTFNANATIVCNIDNLGVDNGTVTITAEWSSKKYNVRYNCGLGGGSAPNPQTALYNTNFTPATNTCYYDGHTFVGWLVSGTEDVRDANVSFRWMYAEDKVLTAQWSAQTYLINYEMNGGTNYAGAPESYVYGVGATINGTPTRDNSIFKGWCIVNNTNCAMAQTIGRTDLGNKTFYAKWVCDQGSVSNSTNTECEPCPTGTHAENGQCVNDEDFSTCNLPDATEAKRVWNPSIGAYGPCLVVTCADDYHLVANTCVKDLRECQLSNGYGTQEWNGTQWDRCTPTLCDSGFEIVGDHCEECSNRRLNGEIVVSTYANGCEIATCMYHGQKYTLDNNECVPICETKSDETGSMVWNESRKKCVRTCNPGYKMW